MIGSRLLRFHESAPGTALTNRPLMICGCFRTGKQTLGATADRPRVWRGGLIHFLFGPSLSEKACREVSDFNLFSDGERVINLDSEISDRAFHPRVAKQKLNRAQIAGAAVDQGSLRAAERVSAEYVRVKPNAGNPFPTSRAYCRVVMASPGRPRLVKRNWPEVFPATLR
jgi:hypothetical protein